MDNISKSRAPLWAVNLYDRIQLFLRFISIRKKLTGKHDFPEPFFIIGCGRSGNTLLRSLLVAGKQVSIPPESYVWPKVIRNFSGHSFMPWPQLCAIVIGEFEAYKEYFTWELNLDKAHRMARDLPRNKQTLSHILHCIYTVYSEQKSEGVKRWGDKTPINTIYIDKVYKVFPKAQYIHIVRDPLDVVCSYVKANLYDSHEPAALFWKEATTKARRLGKRLSSNQYLEIQYEDLVREPKQELMRICDFLNIEYSDEQLNFWKHKDNLGDAKYRSHHKNLGNPITPNSIGKWKTQISQAEADRIKEIAGIK